VAQYAMKLFVASQLSDLEACGWGEGEAKGTREVYYIGGAGGITLWGYSLSIEETAC
jgi:hypothetical protein